MRRLICGVLIAASAISHPAGGAHAQQDAVQGRLRIAHAGVKMLGAGRALLTLTITNTGGKTDRLLRASTRVAEQVLIFDPVGNEGNGLLVPGSSELVISGGAPRIELSGLRTPLRPADTVNVLLVFQQAGKVVFNAVVAGE